MQKLDGLEIFPVVVDTQSYLQSINFYLIKKEHSLTLVDAGLDNEDCWNALLQTLKSNNFSLRDINEIVLTHNHVDHIGLVNRITESKSIPVFAHEDAIPRLKRNRQVFEMRVDFFTNLYEEMGCGETGRKQVDYLKQMMAKNSNNVIHTEITPIEKEHIDFDIIEIPGHAPDQIALYNQKNNILLSGDLLINHISSNALIEPDSKGNRHLTLIQHKRSLEKVLNLSPNLVYPGHGILIEEASSLVNKRVAGIDRKAEKIRGLIERGISTGNDLAQFYYKKLYSSQFSLVMSEIIGHLDYLENNHQVTKVMKDGVWYYSMVN